MTDGSDNSIAQFTRLLHVYKEFLSVVKDTLEVVWKLAPASLIFPGASLWLYLRKIYWDGLFYESAMSGMGLVFLVVLSIVLSSLVVLMFLVPSACIIFSLPFHKPGEPIPGRVPRLYAMAWLGWVIPLMLVLLLDTAYIGVCLLVELMVTAAFSYRWRRDLAIPLVSEAGRWEVLKKIGGWTLAACFSMSMTLLPLLVYVQVSTDLPSADNAGYKVALGCVGASLVSLIPGFAYLVARVRHAGIYRPIKGVVAATLFVLYVLMCFGVLFTPLSSILLRAGGVYRTDLASFEVRQPGLATTLRLAGLDVVSTENMDVVKGYLRYSFAGTKLLCKSSFDSVKKSSEMDALPAGQRRTVGLAAGAHCVSTSAGELREFRAEFVPR